MTELPDPRSTDRKVRTIRQRLHDIAGRHGRNITVLAVDGIPVSQARRHWSKAQIETLYAEFPTTSSTCWMSATTGLSPAEHGAVGFMQRFQPDHPAECVFKATASCAFPTLKTIFSDAQDMGFCPIVLDGDFFNLAGQWRDTALAGAREHRVGPFYAGDPLGAVTTDILERLDSVLATLLSANQPTLVWCYIDIDLYIHLHGYDTNVSEFLNGLEEVAWRASAGSDVVAVSDHGLVPTEHAPDISDALDEITRHFNAEMAGAGRTRWFYVDETKQHAMKDTLKRQLPESIGTFDRSDLLLTGPYASRVGELIVMARDRHFITDPEYCYDHGSWTESEVLVPWAHWAYRGG